MKKILPLLLLTPTLANAECTPSPDCADMGYSETSCSGKFVRCPFDTSKLFCAPCDSIYKYDCSGENMTGGIGANCNNKYTSCECDTNNGFYFRNGNCVCDTSCDTIGNIYYSDASCSSCIDYNKKPIGIIIKPSEIIVSLDISEQGWGTKEIDISALPNYSEETALTDMSGQTNTQAIVNHYGVETDSSTHAGIHCYNYAPTGSETSLHQWYLPSAGELYQYIHKNVKSIRHTWNRFYGVPNGWFWSSSEFNQYHLWYVIINNGEIGKGYRTSSLSVACFLKI